MKTLSKIELSLLCDIYGQLLTDKQRSALRLYCDYDYSLAEIAEEANISRQGVRDAIVNGEKTLIDLENTLKIAQNKAKTTVALQQALQSIDTDVKKAKDLIASLLDGE